MELQVVQLFIVLTLRYQCKIQAIWNITHGRFSKLFLLEKSYLDFKSSTSFQVIMGYSFCIIHVDPGIFWCNYYIRSIKVLEENNFINS